MMRVAALLRRTSMDDCDRFYAAAGRALHVEGRKPHRPEVAAELLAVDRPRPGSRRRGHRRPDHPRRRPSRSRRGRARTAASACRRSCSRTAATCTGRSSRRRRSATTRSALWDLVGADAALPAPLRAEAAQDRRRHGLRRASSSPRTSTPATGRPVKGRPDERRTEHHRQPRRHLDRARRRGGVAHPRAVGGAVALPGLDDARCAGPRHRRSSRS